MKKIPIIRRAFQIIAACAIGTAFFTAAAGLKPLFLAILLLGGVFYCGWICPFGLMQDIGSRIGTRLGLKKRKVPQSLHRTLIYGRYVLAILAVFWISDTLFALLGYEPRGTAIGLLTGELPSFIALGVLAGFMAVSLVYERPYCRYFCIEGAKYGIFSLFRVFTVRRNPHACVQCGKCDQACPMQIRVSGVENLRSPQCINCLECIACCPVKGALSYGKVTRNESTGIPTAEMSAPLKPGKNESA